MLGPGLDPHDPLTSMLMAGSENYISSPYYPWGNMPGQNKTGASQPSAGGMFSTLAPSALEKSDSFATSAAKPGQDSDEQSTSLPAGVNFDFNPDNANSKGVHGFGASLSRETSHGSGQASAGEGFWDTFVQDGGWTDETAATS